MNINEMIKLTGALTIERRNFRGNVVEMIEVPNLVVSAGKSYIASRMIGTSATVMTHMGIGSDQGVTLALAAGNTALGAELARTNNLFTSSVSSNAVTYQATFAAGVGTGDVKEAGIFNASTSGTMLCRTTFPIVTKQAGDSIAITWVVTVN